MKNKKEINPIQGERLDKCLKEARISQKEFALMSGYTAQHINNIIKGKRGMSLEAARTFCQTLFLNSNGTINIDENYLLGKVDTENFFNAAFQKIQIRKDLRSSLDLLINFLGFERKKAFWKNFDNLSPEEKEEYKRLREKEDSTRDSTQSYSSLFPLKAGCELIFEYQTPNNSPMYITDYEYEAFLDELIEYISFKFNHELKNSDAYYNLSEITPESIVETYPPSIAQERNRIEHDLHNFNRTKTPPIG